MKRFLRAFVIRGLLIAAVCLSTMQAAPAQPRRARAPQPSVAGVYGDFTVGKESGDLEGMRVAIFSAGSGYHAIVQIAQGGAEDPEPVYVAVTVKGTSVEFTAGDQKFTGTVSAAGLTIRGEDGSHLLKRQPCSTYFGR